MGFFHRYNQYTFPRHFFTAVCGIAVFVVISTLTYYIAEFTKTTAIIIALITPIITAFITRQPFTNPQLPTTNHQSLVTTPPIKKLLSLTLTIGAITLFFSIIGDLKNATTPETVRTPWEFVNSIYFTKLTTLAAITLSIAWLGSRFALLTSALTGIASLSVALFVYKVGFGFDPFLHRAAEQFIAENGVITPKSPYYIGQYVLVVGLHHLTGVAIKTIDLWLLPILASLTPLALYASLDRTTFSQRTRLTTAIAFFTAPLAAFIATTPQGLANLFALTAVIAALTNTIAPKVTIIIAIASATIHPIVGIPVTIILIAQSFNKKILTIAGTIIAAITVPAMFFVNGILSGAKLSFAGAIDHNNLLSTLLGIVNHRQFTLFTDFAYGWHALRPLVIIALATIFLWQIYKSQTTNHQPPVTSHFSLITIPLALFTNALLLIIFRFPFLVATEQLNYSSRLTEAALLLTVPFALHTLAQYLQKIPDTAKLMRFATIPALTFLIAAATYTHYPRVDTHTFTRAFSTSQHDVDAVRSIAEDAAKHNITNYTVLANQSVSAGAVNEYGFKKYFPSQAAYPNVTPNTPIFFYPLPTSSPLYDVFLATNNTYGKREVALRAAQLTGAKTVYFIVNDYWWEAKRIISEATAEADRSWTINDSITVFVYTTK